MTFADTGYAGDRVAYANAICVEIVRKPTGRVDFAIQPCRWVVERFFAWLGRNRRLAEEIEASSASAHAFLYAANLTLVLRRVAGSG